MNIRGSGLRKALTGLFFVMAFGLLTQAVFSSTIAGFVYDKQRNPLREVDMELLNEYHQQLRRTKTEGAGRYQFVNLVDGNYTVKALPFRYDLEDQEWPIEISTFGVRGAGIGNVYISQDFYLSPKKGGISDAETGVVFVQEVPDEARELYKQAVKSFGESRSQDGVDGLVKALKIFPDYYEALYRMGKELYIVGKYDYAWRYLLKATEVNEKSGPSYYYMGYCFYRLGEEYYKAAVTSLKQATVLTPASMQVFFALGMVQRAAGSYEEAEKHLLFAKKLASKPVAEIQKELVQLYGNNMKKFDKAADELEIYMKVVKMSDEEKKTNKATIEKWRAKAKTQGSQS